MGAPAALDRSPRRCGLTMLFTTLLFLFPTFLYLQCIRPWLPSDRAGANGPDTTWLHDRGSSLLHSWDDDQLFARAVANSSRPRRASSPNRSSLLFWASQQQQQQQQQQRRRKPPPKIAFLFLTTGRLPFEPLWSNFFDGNQPSFNIYVHSDPFSFDLFNRSSPFWGRCIPSRPTSRASPSLIAATRRLLANALLDDPNNAYFALLSQSCIPLHSFRRLYTRLFSNTNLPNQSRSFIEVIAESRLLPSRYNARGKGAMLPEVHLQDFRIGSQWFVLTRRHAAMFVADTKYWPKFSKPCLEESRFSCYPEEHYFSTVMNLLDPEGTHGYSLTRVHWPPDTDGHPATYHGKQVDPGFIRQLQQEHDGRFMFARKFDADALEALLRISDVVLS